MRILLFLGTNIAVLVLVSIVFNLLGLQGILAGNGVDLGGCAQEDFGAEAQQRRQPGLDAGLEPAG